ncbi:MAG TPA: hypothetical protein VGP68_10780, partial [Gemmataceae bacterium]|nr:hypothetical protein [Gemmataceae bacterium]
LKSLALAVVVLGSLGVGVGSYAHHAMAVGLVAGGEEPQAQVRKSDRGGMDVEQAKAALKQAEAGLAAAQANVEKMKAVYRETLERSSQVHGEDAINAFARGVASRFKYRIPVELGQTQSNEGGRIEIKEIWGTRPQIEIGGQYMVHGNCTMPSRKRGKLYFYVTSSGPWGLSGEATFDLQSTTVEKDKGEFTLVHGMGGPGEFHLILYSDDGGKEVWLANQYFK